MIAMIVVGVAPGVSLYDLDRAQGSQPPPVQKVVILMDGSIVEETLG